MQGGEGGWCLQTRSPMKSGDSPRASVSPSGFAARRQYRAWRLRRARRQRRVGRQQAPPALCSWKLCLLLPLLSVFWYFSPREAIMWGLFKMSLLPELEKAVLLIGTLVCRRRSGAADIFGGFPTQLENTLQSESCWHWPLVIFLW